MAEGALRNSRADIAVSVTGVAGPGGGTEAKPVGLVHFGAARRAARPLHREKRFGDLGRRQIRLASVGGGLRDGAGDDLSTRRVSPLMRGDIRAQAFAPFIP